MIRYSRPMRHLPAHLMGDPIHAWRARTGIELIHREPTRKELERIHDNWMAMRKGKQKKSDKQSIKFFGVDNMTHYNNIISNKVAAMCKHAAKINYV